MSVPSAYTPSPEPILTLLHVVVLLSEIVNREGYGDCILNHLLVFPVDVRTRVSYGYIYRPLKSLIGERIFMVLNIEKNFVTVRVYHFLWQDGVFVLCSGMH